MATLQTLETNAKDRVLCVVFGPDASKNEMLFKSAIRMASWCDRFVLIGDMLPAVRVYLDMGGPLDVFPVGTPVPGSENVRVLDGRAASPLNAST